MSFEDGKYLRKLTKLEYLYFTYNNILQRIVGYEIDVEFFEAKAKLFKHDSPQAIEALRAAVNSRESITFNKLTLDIINSQILKEQAKQNKPKKLIC